MITPEVKRPAKSTRKTRTKHSPQSYERIAILVAALACPIKRVEITGQIIADTVGGIVISKSTAYQLISELEATGYLIKKGTYTLSDKGIRTLRTELYRIDNQSRIIRTRLHV